MIDILDIKEINGVPVIIDLIEQIGAPNVRTNIPVDSISVITIHNTANTSPTAGDEMHRIYFNNLEKADQEYVGAKIFVDEDSITQILPLLEVVYDTSNEWYQYNSISIEICENGNYEKAEKNAIALVVYLIDKFGLNISDVKSHYDASGKYCPHIILDYGWDKFIQKVESKMTLEKLMMMEADEISKMCHDSSDLWEKGYDFCEKYGKLGKEYFGDGWILQYIRTNNEEIWMKALKLGYELGKQNKGGV